MSSTHLLPFEKELVMVFYRETTKVGGHHYIHARPYYLEDGKLRNGLETLVNGWNIEDLMVTAWFSLEYPELNFGSIYDSIRYANIYSMGAKAAMDKAKTLTRLEKATNRGQEAKTFGDYVAKVAKAMKIKRFRVCVRPAPMLGEAEYVELTLKQAITWMNSNGEILPKGK